MVKISIEKYLGFEAYIFSNDRLELIVVPEIGGRIMSYGPIGTNILFVNKALEGIKPKHDTENVEDLFKLRVETGYMLYGGEKTWIAPQDDWNGPPYMELDHGSYSIELVELETGLNIVMKSPICRETRLKITRSIFMPSKGTRIEIKQAFENCGSTELYKGLWQVTMLNKPGRVAFKCEGPSDYVDGVKIFEGDEYEKERLQLAGGRAIVSCEDDNMFKVGTDVNLGYLDVVVIDESKDSELIFHEEYEIVPGPFGHGCSVEVFNSKEYPYFEVELHSPLVRLAPGERYEYTVWWSLT
jgi:hypothetical protein